MRLPAAALSLPLALVLLAGCDSGDGRTKESRAAGGVEAPETPATPPPCSTPPVPGTELKIVPRWAAGQARSYTVTKSRDDDHRPALAWSASEQQAELEVVEARPGGPSRLRWKTTGTETLLSGAGLEAALDQPGRRDKLMALGELTVEYSTDETGTFVGVENLEALRDHAGRTLDLLEELTEGSDQFPQAAMDAARDLITSDAYLQPAMIQEIAVLHALYGATLVPGEPTKFDDELPNPFGGRPFPAVTTIELQADPDTAGCAVIDMVVEPDPEQFGEVLLESMSEKYGVDIPDTESLPSFSIDYTIRYTYDPSTGWMRQIEAKKDITADGKRRVDRTVIRAAS